MLQAPIFKADFFSDNRRRLRQLTGPGLVTIESKSSDFWYLTGIDEAGMTLVMDGSREYLIVPEKTVQEIAFEGELDLDSLRRISGIDKIKTGKSKSFTTRKILDAAPHLASLRMIKSDSEIAAIQYAIDHTIQAFNLVGKKLTRYKNEQSIAADMTHYFILNELHHAYDPIIAGGVRAVTLHYNKNNQPLDPTQCLLLDVGAASPSLYCADITRTVAVHPSERLRAVYDAVLEIQLFAIDYLKPGILLKDYEQAVLRLMGEKLRNLRLIEDNEVASIRKFYPHSTSHFLGLDVHDVGDYTLPLQPGMVLTVEPGIYIKDENIGVRIEDDVLITRNGNRVLSSDLPKDVSTLTIKDK